MEQAKENKLNLIDVIVFVFYYLFVSFSFLALFGFFNRFLVFAVLVFLALALFFLRRLICFNKRYFWFFILTPVVAAGFGLLRGFFTGDAYWVYLPAARDIVLHSRIGDFFVGYYLSQMPLLTLLFAGTFAVFGSFNEFLCLWVPFFFTAATLILLLKWAREKNLSRAFLFFLPFLFLTSSSVAYWGGWNLLQEAPLLFFATAFFYYYEKYSISQQKKDLLLFILSFVLMVASKLIGLFLVLLIPLLFLKSKNKKTFLVYLFVFSVPLLFWFFRNYFVYDNPIFPLLNSFFKGSYYFALKNSYFPGYLQADRGLIPIIGSVMKYLWLGFPFILLSFYGFLKERRYQYLILFILFFFLKEIFYFTPTVSVLRYYYLFWGLLLVYGLLGLEKLKSRFGLWALMLLAVFGLLLVPATDSTSGFISLIEKKFFFLGQLIAYLGNYWYLVLIVIAPFAFRLSKNKWSKIFLIFLFSLYLLHLGFIANKSWLNTWPFILLALIFLIILGLVRKEIRYFKEIIIGLIVLMVFVNSWLMAVLYYWHQGNIILPVPYVWEDSRWSHQVLDKETASSERKDFYILVAVQVGYFYWWTDYQPINLFDFDFWKIVDGYNKEMLDSDLYKLLLQKNIKYIVKNGEKYRYDDPNNTEFAEFFDKIKNSPYFKLVANQDNNFVFRVGF